MDFPILFEDDAFFAINKPPGVVVNNAESVKGETVQDWAAARMTNAEWQMTNENKDFIERAGIVHRIDKETSGILLIAKNPASFIELQRQFKERLIHKTYLALTHGKIVPAEGEIRAPVGRLPWNKERFGIVPGGKESVTQYTVISSQKSEVTGDDVSFVELRPETGRTHQIRVHLKYINHPILGDYLYAGRKTSRDDRTYIPRVMLHAWKLVCLHPVTGEPVAIEAPIPDDIKSVYPGI